LPWLPGDEPGIPRNGLVALYDPYLDAYGLDEGGRAALQTAIDRTGRGNHATYGTTAGADANDPSNTGLAYSYDGVDDVLTGIPSYVRSYVLAGDSYGIGAGWVYGKRTNVTGLVYYALFYNRRLSEAEEATLYRLGQQILASRGFTGTCYPWAFPIVTTAGTMDFSVKTTAGRLWVFPDGTTSTAEKPAPSLASGGTTWVYCPDWRDPALELNDNTTDARYVGDLKDIPRVSYYLDLRNCANITGSLADAPRVSYYLDLRNCANITGSLADAPRVSYLLNLTNCSNITGALADAPRVSYYLNLYNCTNLTGSLADAPRVSYLLILYNCTKITGTLADAPRVSYYLDLRNCANITGSLDGTWCPTYLYLKGIGWSTAECDQTLINFANGSLTNKSITISAGKRSSASDSAVATLISRGWTVTES